jgi:hypothetical protein
MNIFEIYSGHFEHCLAFLCIMIAIFGHNPNNATVYDEHRTGPTWSHTAIECPSLDGYTLFCRLTDSILLCMYGPNAMFSYTAILVQHLSHLMTNVIAMWQT